MNDLDLVKLRAEVCLMKQSDICKVRCPFSNLKQMKLHDVSFSTRFEILGAN